MEFGAVEAQKAAVAAHPQVAVPRLQDGVCLVGRQAVGLVEYRSHIGRLQLHRPRRDTAQHRQQYRQQPCSFSIHSAFLSVKCSMPVCLRRGRRQGLFAPPVGLTPKLIREKGFYENDYILKDSMTSYGFYADLEDPL